MPKISVPAPLTGGTAGYALAKSSNNDNDLTWAASTGGGLLPAQPGGYWYDNRPYGAALSGTFTPSTTTTYWIPAYLNTARTITGLGFLRNSTVSGTVGVVAVATCTAKALPGSLLYSGGISATTAAAVTLTGLSVPTPQGWFYIGIQYTATGLTPYTLYATRLPPFPPWPTTGPSGGAGAYCSLSSNGAPAANPTVSYGSTQPHAAYLI